MSGEVIGVLLVSCLQGIAVLPNYSQVLVLPSAKGVDISDRRPIACRGWVNVTVWRDDRLNLCSDTGSEEETDQATDDSAKKYLPI